LFPLFNRVADVPRIECKDTWASVGNRSIFLQCKVVARPQSSALYWQLDHDSPNGTSDNHEANGRLPQGEHIVGDGYYWTVARVSEPNRNAMNVCTWASICAFLYAT
jgi:hypothetical protein